MVRRSLLALALVAIALLASEQPVSADGPVRPSSARVPLRDVRPVARFGVSLVDAFGNSLPAFDHHGRRFVLGAQGERYGIRIDNPTSSRVEAVVSVDGLDAIRGTPASLANRGYAIPPLGSVTLEGFRTSMDAVAAFRFGTVAESYASRTGDARNVGVIGVAFFRERILPAPPRPLATRRSAPKSDPRDGAPATGSAPSKSSEAHIPFDDEDTGRRGLGTSFGEERVAPVRMTTFERADRSPIVVRELRYDDRDGLRAVGIVLPPDPRALGDDWILRQRAQPFPGMRFAQPPD